MTAGRDLLVPPGGGRAWKLSSSQSFVARKRLGSSIGQAWVRIGLRPVHGVRPTLSIFAPVIIGSSFRACNHHGVWQEKSALPDISCGALLLLNVVVYMLAE